MTGCLREILRVARLSLVNMRPALTPRPPLPQAGEGEHGGRGNAMFMGVGAPKAHGGSQADMLSRRLQNGRVLVGHLA
jgi:hypothetical protein